MAHGDACWVLIWNVSSEYRRLAAWRDSSWITTPFGRSIRRAVRLESSVRRALLDRLSDRRPRSLHDRPCPKPAPNQAAHATTAPTRSWTTSSGEIWKLEDTGLQTTDPDKNGFVGRLPRRLEVDLP
ncbi:MAG UNVERIFIED_CONTAM: hypothetical protein LVR18_19370 [Planctomycetaceae bacterium]